MHEFSFSQRVRQGLICATAFVAGWTCCLISAATAGEGAVASSIKSASATHKQKQIVKVANSSDGQKLEDFCIDRDGKILALLGPIGPGDDEMVFGDEDDNSLLGAASRLFSSKKKKTPKFECAIHVYDSEGKLTEKWPVGFSGQAINTAPDGSIVVGGNGRVARFDVNGKKLLEAESPQMTYINDNPDEMRERAKEQLESD